MFHGTRTVVALTLNIGPIVNDISKCYGHMELLMICQSTDMTVSVVPDLMFCFYGLRLYKLT